MEQEFKHRVLGCLPQGKEYAITGRELAVNLHMVGQGSFNIQTRRIRLAIQELIADGFPVCSSTKQPAGYFIARSREEVNENLKVLKYGYGSEIFRHYRNLAHARNKMFPQLGMKI